MSQCTAMGNLRKKAEEGNRLSNSEAFHFADVMLSVSGGTEFIHDTMRLSLKDDYKQTKTRNEINRIAPLYPTNCLTLVRQGICPDYCKESVRTTNQDPLVPGTSPCSVWLKRTHTLVVDTANLIERVATAENIKRAFFQLKYYHEYEDALFFDPFDFEHFENRLDANCEVIAKALLERNELPFAGYLKVPVPKKLSDRQQLEYRVMSYSTIYDQVPLQAIFNVIGPIVESKFQDNSYGYRWNNDPSETYRIFQDWQEAYPKFRSDIMTALKQYPNGFHFCCDIKGYYDHIDHSILLEQVRQTVPDTYLRRVIERFVRAYASTDSGNCGLPQGPAYARLLANMYLNDFDIFARKLSTGYFRYVDDFVLVFESENAAQEGLERIIYRLQEQGLELSQDEMKKATIDPNTDISRLRRTLDKIHYGILEGTRHVQHLVPEAVADFADAVERHSVSPITIEQLVRINDVLPSILYVVTQESMFPHPLRARVFAFIEFLIQHQWFCPKKLKTVFYRLLEIESDTNRLCQLFQAADPIHRVYFLLSVFGCWQSHSEHRQLLESLVHHALTDNNAYVWGFAVVIAAKLKIELSSTVDGYEKIPKFSKPEGLFSTLKWLSTIDYLNQSDDDRTKIRELVDPQSSDLLKMFLLNNTTHLPTVYVDSVYLNGLLQASGVLLLPTTCKLLAAATDKSEFFDSLLRFATSQLEFKRLVVSWVVDGISDRRAKSGLAEIENLKELYVHVSDDELKQAMQNALSRIMRYGLSCDEDFAKQHKQIDHYNGCFLFESIEEEGRYNYLELIPEETLRRHIQCDLDTFRAIVDDFSAKAILPVSKFVYDSGGREIRLEFSTDRHYRVLDHREFSFAPKSIERACNLMAEVYRKACYFRHVTGKAPRISPENIMIDADRGTAVFRSIGRSLCAGHVFAGTAVGNEEADIAKMISLLLEALIFDNKAEATKFLIDKVHSGLEAFLALFLQKMGAKEPGHRYTCSRFVYLVNQLAHKPEPAVVQDWLRLVYLRERLKGALFRWSPETITWNGICRALNEHLSTHIRAVCSREVLQAHSFHSRILTTGRGQRQLHSLARNLLDLALSRVDFPDAERVDPAYLDLVEFLLSYASICIEIVALAKTLRSTQAIQYLSSSPILTHNQVKIVGGGYNRDLSAMDLSALIIQESKENENEAITGLSLFQLALQCLLACEIRFHDDSIELSKPVRMNDDVFRHFVHICLIRVPRIEVAVERELKKIFLALRLNEDFTRLDSLRQIRNDVEIVVQDLYRIRTDLHLSRVHGRADGRYFPPDIRCRSFFHKTRIVTEKVLPGCALTNSFPSNRCGYVCSWDFQGTSVANLMIPSEGVNSLMNDLKKGKFFGYKISSIYCGKTKIFWDTIVLAIDVFLLAICELVKGSATASTGVKGFCSVLTYLFGALAVAILGKIVFHDIGYWIPSFRQFLKSIRKEP